MPKTDRELSTCNRWRSVLVRDHQRIVGPTGLVAGAADGQYMSEALPQTAQTRRRPDDGFGVVERDPDPVAIARQTESAETVEPTGRVPNRVPSRGSKMSIRRVARSSSSSIACWISASLSSVRRMAAGGVSLSACAPVGGGHREVAGLGARCSNRSTGSEISPPRHSRRSASVLSAVGTPRGKWMHSPLM